MKKLFVRSWMIVIMFALVMQGCEPDETDPDPTDECPATVTDIDGNVYNVLQIGGQCWMQENLKTTRYKNGDAIPTGFDDEEWAAATSGAYAIYEDNAANNTIYGKLYNWYAVDDSRGLCPEGWRVPNEADWYVLSDSLGGWELAGGKMKTTTGWAAPNTGATNESGFSALPGGYRIDQRGYFLDLGELAAWWSSDDLNPREGFNFFVDSRTEVLYYHEMDKDCGASVRCVKDTL